MLDVVVKVEYVSIHGGLRVPGHLLRIIKSFFQFCRRENLSLEVTLGLQLDFNLALYLFDFGRIEELFLWV